MRSDFGARVPRGEVECQQHVVGPYFCEPDYLSALYGVSHDEAEAWRAEAAANVKKARDTFLAKRRVITRVVWPDGGGPDATKLWDESGQNPSTVIGKDLWSAPKPVIKKAGHDDKLMNAFTIPAGFEVATELKKAPEEVTA